MILVFAIAALVAIATAVFILGVALARRVVAWRPPREVEYTRSTQDIVDGTVTLPNTRETRAPGSYGLWYDGRAGHAVVGRIAHSDERLVVREVLDSSGSELGSQGRGTFGGHVFVDPSQFGVVKDIELTTTDGPIKLWEITPPQIRNPSESDTWAIHVHGIRSTREGVLRSVPAASARGMTSLVMSFAGEEQSSTRPGVNSALGLREWHDVDTVIAHALAAGAKRVVLFAWSMGASAALLASERSSRKDAIAALVLVDPAGDWKEIVRAAARQAHAPALFAALACALLATPAIYRLTGAPLRISFGDLDWTRQKRVEVPILVIHSRGDRLVPFSLSPRLVEVQGPGAILEVFDAVPHCAEYNASPARFNETIDRWLDRLSALTLD